MDVTLPLYSFTVLSVCSYYMSLTGAHSASAFYINAQPSNSTDHSFHHYCVLCTHTFYLNFIPKCLLNITVKMIDWVCIEIYESYQNILFKSNISIYLFCTYLILKGSHRHIYPCTNSACFSSGNTFMLKHLSLESEKTVASPPCQLALGFTMKVRVWVASLTTVSVC